MHRYTYKKKLKNKFVDEDELTEMLDTVKQNYFYKYKKFFKLKKIVFKQDGIIHGDIFKDNTVFDAKNKIGIFDFSDSGDGDFAFDVGIALFGFGIKRKSFLILFLKSYNQQAVKKLTMLDLTKNIEFASNFYGLKRLFLTHT